MPLPRESLRAQLKKLPKIDDLLRTRAFAELDGDIGPVQRTNAARAEVETRRAALLEGRAPENAAELDRFLALETVAQAAAARAREEMRPSIRRVVNATGVVLHTGLGRAVLPPAALEAIAKEMTGYCNLALDGETGQRASRDRRIEELLIQLTGCEAATVVNNNCAATLLTLSALGAGREVIVSRGQLIEIGGAFRLPDVMAQSACKLVEVGTTNRTHPTDYERAITDQTAILFRAHPSNYAIQGFTSEVAMEEIARIAHDRGLIAVDDMGGGVLAPAEQFCARHETTVRESLAAGSDVVLFSTDKLIGGPQGGAILGRGDLIARIRKHPLARAVRIDKMTACALEAALKIFLRPDRLRDENPTWRMLTLGADVLRKRARALATRLRALKLAVRVSVVPGASRTGSGALPVEDLPTWLVRVESETMSPDALAQALRCGEPPVFARIQDDILCLDPRTLLDGDDARVAEALKAALQPSVTVS